ncbi:MAG: small basic protein [Candidatus Omnitrophica bacterium CG07_land_8_20_14_0_80_42_15]|uniref:Small basic protein n=1 Tax=Candidatus Aquitaenariimonas noxiae TaxID=1974741 RepID=A0A2J0KRU4_9BACT|nr:MAG: small basic protein [Candidatus Omnitrophica bacterium CG07_land_8_20_14_0_80_42_15]
MSQHPSLRSGKSQKQHRSVLKRYERLKHLKEKELWDEDKNKIFGLPKVKMLKFRVKKEKAAVEETAAEGAAAATAVPAGTAPDAAAKTKAPAPEMKEKAAPKKEKK